MKNININKSISKGHAKCPDCRVSLTLCSLVTLAYLTADFCCDGAAHGNAAPAGHVCSRRYVFVSAVAPVAVRPPATVAAVTMLTAATAVTAVTADKSPGHCAQRATVIARSAATASRLSFRQVVFPFAATCCGTQPKCLIACEPCYRA